MLNLKTIVLQAAAMSVACLLAASSPTHGAGESFSAGLSHRSAGAFARGQGTVSEQNEGGLCLAVRTAAPFPELFLMPPDVDDVWGSTRWSFGQVTVTAPQPPRENMSVESLSLCTARYSQKSLSSQTFSVEISRLSPAVLVESSAAAINLFAGLKQPIVSYVAFETSAGPVVRPLAANGEAVDLSGMTRPWLLVWFGERSIYTPNMHWYGNPPRYLDLDIWMPIREKADRPFLLVLQRRPASCAIVDRALQLRYPTSASQLWILPFTGVRWLSLSQTAPWSEGLPAEVAQRARRMTQMVLGAPVAVDEQVAVDPRTERFTLRSRFLYRQADNEWNEQPLRLAPIPPLLATLPAGNSPVRLVPPDGATVSDLELPTFIGPYKAVVGSDSYDMVVDSLLRYLRVEPQPASAGPDAAIARARLIEEIRRMCAAGHLRPLRIAAGKTWIRYYWANPGLTIHSLALALPHLPDDVRRDALRYIESELKLFPPERVGSVDPAVGSPREHYPLPATVERPQVPSAAPPLGNVYGLWLLAHHTGDFQRLVASYEDLRSLFVRVERLNDWATFGPLTGSHPDPQSDEINSRINGVIAFVRIAREARQDEDVLRGQELLVRLLVQRLAMDSFINYVYDSGMVTAPAREWATLRPSPSSPNPAADLRRISRLNEFGAMIHTFSQEGSRGYVPSMFPFLNMTGELAAFMRDHLLESTRQYMAAADFWWFAWDVALAPQSFGGENAYNPPGIAEPGFQALARILRLPPNQLIDRLDIPQCRVGDLEYIRKLVALIESAN